MRACDKNKRRVSLKYTQPEKLQLIKRFESAKLAGKIDREAIVGLGVSLPTIYRWKSNLRYASRSMPAKTDRALSIDEAIKRLVSQEPVDRTTFLEALFKFIVWLRWPHDSKYHSAATSICVVAYLTCCRHEATLDQLPAEDIQLLARHMRIDMLRRLYTDEAIDLPNFDQGPIHGQPYDDVDFSADIVWFILAYEPPSADKRDAASLSKAYFASQNLLFKYDWPFGAGRFRNYWRDHGAAMPFHYVDRYHPGLEIPFDPMDPDFHASIVSICDRPDLFRAYLARCRAAVEMMRARLDTRALHGIRFPEFPPELRPEPFVPIGLPDDTAAIMRGYRKG